MKYVIDVQFIENRPKDWSDPKAWPGNGVYQVDLDEDNQPCGWLCVVSRYSVDVVFGAEHLIHTLYVEPGQAITESLLLKAIAAASRPELLIGEKQL